METTQIGWASLAASLVLVAVSVALSIGYRLRLEATILWSAARAAGQLLAVGGVLAVLLYEGTPLALSWVWVAGMLLFAAVTIRLRAPAAPGIFWLGLISVSVVSVLSLGVIFGMGIFPLEARSLVPLAGMMIGNAMSETVLAAKRVLGEFVDHRLEIEARLALALPSREAGREQVREALRTAIIPQIERTKAVGLVILPGAMTGLILGGVDPIDAVQVQLAIMYLILGTVVTSVVVVGTGLARRLFTPDHRLVPLPDP